LLEQQSQKNVGIMGLKCKGRRVEERELTGRSRGQEGFERGKSLEGRERHSIGVIQERRAREFQIFRSGIQHQPQKSKSPIQDAEYVWIS
jgi:hypothetical protein